MYAGLRITCATSTKGKLYCAGVSKHTIPPDDFEHGTKNVWIGEQTVCAKSYLNETKCFGNAWLSGYKNLREGDRNFDAV